MSAFTKAAVAATLTLLAIVPNANAQVRASERGRVSQMVDGTTIEVDYGRPQTRGRTVFPDVVKWGETWTPGANWSTTITVDGPFHFGGKAVPAGKYSLWTVPGQTEWTVHLHKNAGLFHEAHPPLEQMMVSVSATPRAIQPAEILTFEFPHVERNSTTMEFRWGTVAIDVPIEVEPHPDGSRFTVAEAAAYVGKYAMLSKGEKGDSTREAMEITLKDNRLVVSVENEDVFIFVRAPKQPNTFYVAFVEKGDIVDVEENSPVRIQMSGNRATTLVAHSAVAGAIWFRAVRADQRR
jgi:hypothetical protein